VLHLYLQLKNAEYEEYLQDWAKRLNVSVEVLLERIIEALAEQLAERTGFKITHTHVSNYERDRMEPFLETTLAYARLANVEMKVALCGILILCREVAEGAL
jgi:transcriptional regulator with XRE-family HTH domain